MPRDVLVKAALVFAFPSACRAVALPWESTAALLLPQSLIKGCTPSSLALPSLLPWDSQFYGASNFDYKVITVFTAGFNYPRLYCSTHTLTP
jgi:hypothetical protein